MNKKPLGVLAGAVAGAIALRLAQDSDPVVVPIVIGSDGQGPRLTTKPLELVHLRFRQRIVWQITNNTDYEVRVAIENWRSPHGGRVLPAGFADQEGQPGLWEKVEARGHGEISAKGRLAKFLIVPEECEYDVYLNDTRIVDPIVKLIL